MSDHGLYRAFMDLTEAIGDIDYTYAERLNDDPRDVATLLLARARQMPK